MLLNQPLVKAIQIKEVFIIKRKYEKASHQPAATQRLKVRCSTDETIAWTYRVCTTCSDGDTDEHVEHPTCQRTGGRPRPFRANPSRLPGASMMDKANPTTTFGVFKPVGHTLIAFYTEDELNAAVAALMRLGFLKSSMVRYSAAEMAAQVDAELLAASPLANFGYELDLIHLHTDLAKKGCCFLVVDAPTDVLSAQVAALVPSIKPATAQHYGHLLIG
jgi:hypothetical protein